MLEAISITDARRDFLPLLSRIESEPYRFMVTKHGKPVAVVLNYAEYSRMMETLRLMENSRWSQRLDAGINQADTCVLVEASTLRSRHA
jgi:prevent-host-death family protein